MKTIGLRIGRSIHMLIWPALWVYLRFTSRTRVLIIADDTVLLVEGWLDDSRLGLPGGGLHRGEEPAVGAVRELAEETGLVVPTEALRFLAHERHHERGLSFDCHFFVAERDRPGEVVRQRHEIATARWMLVSELATVPHKTEVDRALELLAKR